MVVNRPEQPLLLILTLGLLLPIGRVSGRANHLWLTTASLFLVVLFFAQHAKALFFIPAWFVVLSSVGTPKWQRMFVCACGAWAAATCFSFFSRLTECKNDFVREAFSSMMISPKDLVQSPIQTATQMLSNGGHLFEYLDNVLFKNAYSLEWIPENYGLSQVAHLFNGVLFCFVGLVIFLILLQIFNDLRVGSEDPLVRYRNRVSVALLVGVFGMSVFQTSNAFYESALVLPVLCLVGVLTFDARKIRFLMLMSGALAILSVVILSYRFNGIRQSEWAGDSPLVGQEHSVKVAYQEKIKGVIDRLSRECDLKDETSSKHLVVDDLTYPYFMKTREPYHAVYVLGWWGKMSIENPEEFLKEKGSGGLLSQCKWLPESLLGKAIRDQDLCCLRAF
jgi:hypothetical protein